MALDIPVVSFPSGLVSDRSSEASTLDLPREMDDRVTEVAIDRQGLVHFRRLGGDDAREPAHVSPLRERGAGEAFLIAANAPERDEHGWEICRLCVRER